MFRLKIILCLLLIACQSSLSALSCLFSHGLVDTHAQGSRYIKRGTGQNRFLLMEEPFSFDYSDAAIGWTKYFKVRKSSLAQQDEINKLEAQYKRITQAALYDEDILLMGVSRGASVIINFVAQKHPEKVRALLLESPFDRARNIMYSTLKKVPYGKSLTPLFLHWSFPRHSQSSTLHPEDMAKDIPLFMPILLICSKEDTVIPCSSTINLFKKLKETGHTEVYLLVTEHGNHAKILWGPDGERYQAIVHAFFARYFLPYDAYWAERGAALLDSCR